MYGENTINRRQKLIVNGLFRNRFADQIYDKTPIINFCIAITYKWNVDLFQSDRLQALAKASAC